MLNTLTL